MHVADAVAVFVHVTDAIVNNAGILRDRSFARLNDTDWGNNFVIETDFAFVPFFCVENMAAYFLLLIYYAPPLG